jgi:hypothetical protein
LPGRHQQAEGDGQVEAACALGQVCGCEVDDGAPRMAAVAEVGQSAFNAVDALLDRHFGESDQNGFGQTGRGIDFHLDGKGVDADEGEGVELGQHPRSTWKGRGVGNQDPFYPTPRCFAIDSSSVVRRCPATSADTIALSFRRPWSDDHAGACKLGSAGRR